MPCAWEPAVHAAAVEDLWVRERTNCAEASGRDVREELEEEWGLGGGLRLLTAGRL